MRVHLVNPSDVSFGTAVITPRWLYVLAGATPASYGDPVITDETLEPFDPTLLQPGDIVGMGIHTSNALRGYQIGHAVRDREAGSAQQVAGIPLSRYWLIPPRLRPKIYTPHPAMSAGEIRLGTQLTWDRFYSLTKIWERSKCVRSLKGRLAFLMILKLYRQMYANTGIATDSARHSRSTRWARWLASPCRRLFMGSPMPELNVPDQLG